MIWSQVVGLFKSDLDVQRTKDVLIKQKLMLSSNLRCDQIYKYKIHDSGHTLLCFLSQTLMFIKPTSASGFLARFVEQISSLAATLGVTKFVTFAICCFTQVQVRCSSSKIYSFCLNAPDISTLSRIFKLWPIYVSFTCPISA
jgi:hypothetical protein